MNIPSAFAALLAVVVVWLLIQLPREARINREAKPKQRPRNFPCPQCGRLSMKRRGFMRYDCTGCDR